MGGGRRGFAMRQVLIKCYRVISETVSDWIRRRKAQRANLI